MQRLLFFLLILLATQPAHATAFCPVLKSADGFVALREKPDANARLIAHMRADDEVQLLDGRKGRWREVLHWPGDSRFRTERRITPRRGWVNGRYIGECG